MPTIPPPAYVAAGLLGQHLLAPRRRPGVLRSVAAAALAAGSVAMFGGTVKRFRQRGTTVNPFEPARASAMVTDGPNTLTRNPMYVAMAGVLAAHAVLRGGWLTPLPVLAFVAVIDRTQIPAEEAAMRELFGDDYAAYCAVVPRWLGVGSLGGL